MNPNEPYQGEPQLEEGIGVLSPSLQLPIDDKDLLSIINRKIKESETFYKDKLKLYERRETNRRFWLGKHYKSGTDETNHTDNVIYQDLETRIAIAAGRMPDIIVAPSKDEISPRAKSKEVEKFLNIKIGSDTTKRIIKGGLRHHHLDFMAAIKCRWDANAGENGDFVYELVRPNRLLLDHSGTIPYDGFTADGIDLAVELLEEPLGVILAKFPAKREDLFRLLGYKRGTDLQMASKLKYQECWFNWYDKQGKLVNGVCWKYQDIVLGKSKNPYYDWEGFEQPNEEGVETLYRNHFERPRMPYILFSYQTLGISPVDDTTPVEQAIPNQRIVNKRRRQVTEIADRLIPKLAFAGQFITKDDVRRIDNRDIDEHIWIEGVDDVRKAVASFPALAPPPILYQDLQSNISRIDSIFATHGTTRGETIPQESGISKQITREGDLTISDDLSNVVVERVVYEMANWAVQMIKTAYKEPHFVREMGQDGEMLYSEMSRDKVEDGIAVTVKANSVDKPTRRADAINLASRKAIDPYNLFDALDWPNPKEASKLLVEFLMGEADGYAKYMQSLGDKGGGVEVPEEAGNLLPLEQAQSDIQTLVSGQPLQPQGPPSPEYVQAFIDFVQSPDFEALDPQIQSNINQYIQQLRQLVNSATVNPQEGAPSAAQTGQVPQTNI